MAVFLHPLATVQATVLGGVGRTLGNSRH